MKLIQPKTILDLQYVRKRDGRLERFDIKKIINAIVKAAKATGEFSEETAQYLALKVLSLLTQYIQEEIPSVEQIQDVVETVLLDSPFRKTAKAYILYREQHKQIREIASKFNVSLIENYISKSDWQIKENSNIDFSLQGLHHYISSEVSKTYWLYKIYPEEVRQAHINGDFHIHDLGFISTYCVGWDLYDLLIEGFRGVRDKVESKPPKHFRTALGQITNFFYTLQGEAAGAQAFSNFDTLLAPFVYYDDLKYEEVKQAIQEFVFNLNVPTRVGFQTPFTNITFDLEVPESFKNQPVVVGGELKDKNYSEFQEQMDMINRAFLEVMLEGDAKGRVFTFPIPTYNITKDFDWENKNLDILWKVTAKYGIPYFSNLVNSDLKPDDIRSMCCRLRLDNRELRKRGGGLFGSAPLTGSIGVVTINLPRIGFLSNTKQEFFDRLSKVLEIAKTSLEIKRKIIEMFTENGLYPYSKFYLRNIKEKTGKYWINHFSTIGIVGMNEACLNFLNKNLLHKEAIEFALEVLDFIREKLIEFQNETGNFYNLEATPAESTSYRLALLDKKFYPDLKTEYGKLGNIKNPFYTNSVHLPVHHSLDIFEYLDLVDEMQTKFTGGTVVHLFVGEEIEDSEVVKNLVKKICYNYKLPYFSITPTFSVCPNCGYLSGKIEVCPKCSSECEVYSRIVGYLRPVSQWNDGKKEEFKYRSNFKVS
jgi:ribonucleoside-triphosphate reductase